ncbi:probable E3 ubiquitin-protein ligase HECTD2 [Lytechinus variegatus]|uniref:probable E3 ubiquitin-protein ligase HECTD2 n=1 Tax=Lytechinus variegatus TaxID=7654 RepID=UPI001BB1B779|nr:probable E3 ubiquitin-protein ligase HECTD2 [Lytechinus variegatus]
MAVSMAGQVCASCETTFSQGLQSQRAACPSCGRKLVGRVAAPMQTGRDQGNSGASLPPLSNPSSPTSEENTRSKFSGISNFFSNLGTKEKGKSAEKKSKERLPPITPGQAIVSQNGARKIITPETKVSPDFKQRTLQEFKSDVEKAKATKDNKILLKYFESTFLSFAHINVTFKDPVKHGKSLEDCGLVQEYIDSVYKCLLETTVEIQKITLKGIINSLLKDLKKPRDKNDLRAYLVLIQNPQFDKTSTFVIFAHLLRQLSTLADNDHHYMVHWFKGLPAANFKSIVERLQQFTSVRLFPPKSNDLPPVGKCSWWIPSATKVLALLNASNSMCKPLKIPYTCFYNNTLDNIDLMKEYHAWQNPVGHQQIFTFCQYPFVLSLQAKRSIMQKDSEQQMIMTARRTLVAKVQQREMPNMNMLFLNLKVRRSHLVSDSLHEVANKKQDLKKKLRVSFAGEPGLDMGGLTKEWFLLLLRKIFREEYGMFTYFKKTHCFWFNPASTDCNQEFNLVGVLMGLAVYNSIILDIRFPAITYKKLLSPAVVPYNKPQAHVGRCKVTLEDLEQVNPDLCHGLKELLEYSGDVEEDLCTTFQCSIPVYGTTMTYDLKPNGGDIFVTNGNRREYVDLYVNFLLNNSVYEQFAAFYHGFHSVCASNALIMLRPEEVEMLVCGSPIIDYDELEKVTLYDGFDKDDVTIKYFWEVAKGYPLPLQKKLLLFATGSDRIPIGGMGEMSFKIIRVDTSSNMLPMSHTCFNQLILPPYKSKRQLKQKLTIAISNAEGFGLE